MTMSFRLTWSITTLFFRIVSFSYFYSYSSFKFVGGWNDNGVSSVSWPTTSNPLWPVNGFDYWTILDSSGVVLTVLGNSISKSFTILRFVLDIGKCRLCVYIYIISLTYKPSCCLSSCKKLPLYVYCTNYVIDRSNHFSFLFLLSLLIFRSIIPSTYNENQKLANWAITQRR